MSNPYLIQVPFAWNGEKNDIQITRQQGQDPEDATWNIGFPPQTMIPESSGGLPPKGLDFNGLFYAVSSIGAHYSRGDRIQFDADFAEKIGGYSKGFRLTSNDYQRDYISLVDNNKVDPNSQNIAQYWAIFAGNGSVPPATSTTNGTVKLVDALTSTAKDAALTANQGKILSDILDIIAYSPIPFYGNSAPEGFLNMDGRSIDQSKYPKLFARYGEKLPDLRGRHIRGVGGLAAPLGDYQEDAIQNIKGDSGYVTRNDDSTLAGKGTGAMRVKSFGANGFSGYTNVAGLTYGVDFDASRTVRTATETRVKSVSFLYIVKAG